MVIELSKIIGSFLNTVIYEEGFEDHFLIRFSVHCGV